jgi:hypothetical protein
LKLDSSHTAVCGIIVRDPTLQESSPCFLPTRRPTDIAKIAKVSRSTVVHARDQIEKEARRGRCEAHAATPIDG